MIETVEILLLASIAGLAALLLLSLVMIRRMRNARSPTGKHRAATPVQVRPPMDRARRVFHRTLRQALPRHVILAQVGYGRFLTPRDLPPRRCERIVRQLEGMVADYLVCNEALDVVAVVALDDSTGPEQTRLLESAALPLLQWRTTALPSGQEIRSTVHDLETLSSMNRSGPRKVEETTGSERREPTLGDLELSTETGRQEPRL